MPGRSSSSASASARSAQAIAAAGSSRSVVGLGDRGHRGRLVGARRQLGDEALDLAGQLLHLLVLVGLPGEPDHQVERVGAVGGGDGAVAPAAGVRDRVADQPRQPGAAGGAGEQLRVFAGLFEAHLGELERLVGRTDRQVERDAAPGRRDHVVVAPGRLGVVGDHRRVVRQPADALVGEQRLQRRLVQPPPLPADEAAGDRLAQQRVPEAELVFAGLDEHVARDEGGAARRSARPRSTPVTAARRSKCTRWPSTAAVSTMRAVVGPTGRRPGGAAPRRGSTAAPARRPTRGLRPRGRGAAPRGRTGCRRCAGAARPPPARAPDGR